MNDRSDGLSLLDQATLRTWRVLNVATWTVVGIVASRAIQRIAGNLDVITRDWFFHGIRSLDPLGTWFAIAAAIGGGAALGSIFGARVFRSAPAYAGMAAAATMIVHPDVVLQPIVIPAAVVLHVAAAIVSAVRAEHRRPLALRGGHRQ